MRCLFCKSSSGNSRSVEHIIPESIGNKRHIPPRGVVCDKCNNYFSREVEGPLLSHVSFRNLRAWYRVPNKKGSIPSLYGFVTGTDIDIGLSVKKDGTVQIRPERESNHSRLEQHISSNNTNARENILVFPLGVDPPQRQMSRFMSKMALEAFSLRFLGEPKYLELLIDDPHFDRIRNWARRGDNFVEWPFHQRRIFPEETSMIHPETGEWVQAGFGYDLFINKRRETYFAFCLYGYEFVINVGGPSIKGYEEWLQDHGNISPLVERIGLRLEQHSQGGSTKYYLREKQDVQAGQKFD